uniref:G_PROTEIN_RECEP_F1_2 domain-containing protein n=1 Tax=Panagrellus redivivus TaxID=6233 RepID=A0A7E4VAN5_PANRE
MHIDVNTVLRHKRQQFDIPSVTNSRDIVGTSATYPLVYIPRVDMTLVKVSPFRLFHDICYIIMLVLTIISVTCIVAVTFTRIRRRRFTYGLHFNITVMLSNLSYVYMILGPLAFVAMHSERDQNDIILVIAMSLRMMYIFVGAYTLPAIAVERIYATVYVRDYETNTRHYVAFTTLLILDVFCLCMTLTMVFTYHLIMVSIFNIVALAIFLSCMTKNVNHYNEHLKHLSQSSYSLSLRYQLIENIKVAKVSHPKLV